MTPMHSCGVLCLLVVGTAAAPVCAERSDDACEQARSQSLLQKTSSINSKMDANEKMEASAPLDCFTKTAATEGNTYCSGQSTYDTAGISDPAACAQKCFDMWDCKSFIWYYNPLNPATQKNCGISTSCTAFTHKWTEEGGIDGYMKRLGCQAQAPTAAPTAAPTTVPTAAPTTAPTAAPTSAPTAAPTSAPTPVPTQAPTPEPTPVPTQAPTPAPTPAPTQAPTPAPTQAPSIDNCVELANSGLSCKTCEEGYTPGKWSQEGKCRKCTCASDTCNCATCTARGYCTSCKAGYVYDGTPQPHLERCKAPTPESGKVSGEDGKGQDDEALYYKAAGAQNCPAGQIVDSEAECRIAGPQVGDYPFKKVVSDLNNRPAGCFWDKSGGSYFNSETQASATWGGVGAICKQGGR